MGITNLGSAWRVRAFYQSVCGDSARKGNPRVPQPDARWLAAQLPGSVALSLLQGRLGMSITDTIPSANMTRPSFGRTPCSLAAAFELRDGQLHPTIAGTIMAKTPTAKTQTAKKPNNQEHIQEISCEGGGKGSCEEGHIGGDEASKGTCQEVNLGCKEANAEAGCKICLAKETDGRQDLVDSGHGAQDRKGYRQAGEDACRFRAGPGRDQGQAKEIGAPDHSKLGDASPTPLPDTGRPSGHRGRHCGRPRKGGHGRFRVSCRCM